MSAMSERKRVSRSSSSSESSDAFPSKAKTRKDLEELKKNNAISVDDFPNQERFKRHRSSSRDSSSSSSSSTSSSSEEKKKLKRKEMKKQRKERKKQKKKFKKMKKKAKKMAKVVKGAPSKQVQVSIGPAPRLSTSSTELPTRAVAMKPMTKEEWDKKQQVVRRVYDEETGRHRLIKGDGEVIEEIVSRERHKEINQTATRGDGAFFHNQLHERLSRN